MAILNREDYNTAIPKLEKKVTAEAAKPRIIQKSGTLTVRSAYLVGDILQVVIIAKNSSSVASGANVAEGRIIPSPLQYATGVGYYGGRSIVARIESSGSMVVRNASSTSLPADSEVWITVTYVTRKDK